MKYIENNLNTTKPDHSKHILPVLWPFVKLRFHSNQECFYGDHAKTCLVRRLLRLTYNHTLESKTKNPSNSSNVWTFSRNDSANWPVQPVSQWQVPLFPASCLYPVYFLNVRFPTQKIPPWEWTKLTKVVKHKLGTFLLSTAAIVKLFQLQEEFI